MSKKTKQQIKKLRKQAKAVKGKKAARVKTLETLLDKAIDILTKGDKGV